MRRLETEPECLTHLFVSDDKYAFMSWCGEQYKMLSYTHTEKL